MKFTNYLILERNITNAEVVDTFLHYAALEIPHIIPTDARDKIKKWLNSNAKNYLLREYPGVVDFLTGYSKPILDKRIKEKPWIQKAIDRGDELLALRITETFKNELYHVIDYFSAIPDLNISRMSVPEAIKQSKKWTEDINKKASDKEDATGTETIRKYPDGFRWVKVTSAQSLDREGKLMRHCVGSYCGHVSSGRSIIYSLRDKKNEPHCTVEVRGNKVYQIKGKANGPVDEKYRVYVKDFIYKPFGDLEFSDYDLKNVGLISLDGKIYDPANLPTDQDEFAEFIFRARGNVDLLQKSKEYPRIKEFCKKHLTIKDSEYIVKYKNKEIPIHFLILKDLDINVDPKLYTNLLNSLPTPKAQYSRIGFAFMVFYEAKYQETLSKIFKLRKLNPNLVNTTKNHKFVKKILSEVENIVKNHILIYDESNIDEIGIEDSYSISRFFERTIASIKNALYYVPELEAREIKKEIFNHFYHDFAPGGPMTKQKAYALRIHKDLMPYLFDLIK